MHKSFLILFCALLLHNNLYAQRRFDKAVTIQLDSNVSVELPAKPFRKISKLFTADKTVGAVYNDNIYLAAYSDIKKISPNALSIRDSFITAGYTKTAATDTMRRILYDGYVYQECTAAGRKTSQKVVTIDSISARGFVYFGQTEMGEILGIAKLIFYSHNRLYIFESRSHEKSDSSPWLKMMSTIRVANKD
jgi:hypothetical protein